jgi:hypothetical protein
MANISPEKNPSIGAVAYAKSNMMFIARASTGNEASNSSTSGCASFSNKNRWAFLVVDYEGSSEIRLNAKDDEDILKKLQDKYASHLESAIDNAGVKRKEDIRDFSQKYGKNSVHSKSSLCAVNPSLKSLLETFNMRSQVKTLKDEHKEKGALHTRMVLPLDVKECNSYVAKEQNAQREKMHPRKRSQVKAKKYHAYAVLAWAYGYKEDKEGNLTLIKAKEAQVGLVPRARVECGVFFDGTNNNKFNTKMREEYEIYLKEKKKNIKLGQYADGSLEQLIMSKDIPKSKVLPLIYEDLSKNISSYTQAEKEDEYESSWSWIFQNKASEDSEKIYDYFHDESSEEVGRFVEDNLLPDGADSSYTGANTNVVKLHKLYNTDVDDVSHDEHLYECYRDKIYVTGAGTYDHRNTGEHEEDEILGSALAIYSTGLISKVEQACKHLARKLDDLETGYIDTLVLDVFGFSRGAAEARHFVGSIIKGDFDINTKNLLDRDAKEYKEFTLSKQGKNLYPYLIREKEDRKDDVVIDKIVFRFVGIFDTVPHYGLFQDADEEELNLKLEPTKVGRVVHLTAKDEFRHNFDLYSIKSSDSAKLKDNFEEKEFFGAHSDIGGGYIDGKGELVKLAVRIRSSTKDDQDIYIETLVKKWNKDKYWVKNPNYKIIKDKIEIQQKDGFYVVKSSIKNSTNENIIFLYRIFMYRAKIDNEYSQLSLEYMYKQALKIAPLKKELGKLKYKDMEPFSKAAVTSEGKFIWATQTMSEDDFNPYKSQFVHHSINIDGASNAIANSSNAGKEQGLYGKRKIHYVK